jgi:AAA+ superfamily predicted ATPase
MARSDLLIKLVKAGWQGDRQDFKKIVDAIVAEERAKRHDVLANNLSDALKNGNNGIKAPTVVDERVNNLLFETTPSRSFAELVLPDNIITVCNELVEEHSRGELLRSYNLEPRNKILLQGPPGNGKTSLAEAIATALMVPFFVIRYEGVIGTYLGETAVRLRKLFDYACTRKCVLFFDEFDTLGKERGDLHETGEIKRVVSSLLMQIDSLPSYVVVITATNHPELLDRAVWRRFQVRLNLPKPNPNSIDKWLDRFEEQLEQPSGYTHEYLAKQLKGASFAELEEFWLMVKRRFVLSLPNAEVKSIVNNCVKEWRLRITQTGDKSK